MSLGGMGGWGGLNHTPLEMFETSHDLPKSAEKFSKFFLPLPQISLRNLARHVGDHWESFRNPILFSTEKTCFEFILNF